MWLVSGTGYTVSSIPGARVIPCRQFKWVGKPCVDAARRSHHDEPVYREWSTVVLASFTR